MRFVNVSIVNQINKVSIIIWHPRTHCANGQHYQQSPNQTTLNCHHPLLDLKDTFGEVHDNLISSSLDYHHIPGHIKLIVESLYTDFKTSIITTKFRTPFILVGRGPLQGDCLSPLLFNMCFNTFIYATYKS